MVKKLARYFKGTIILAVLAWYQHISGKDDASLLPSHRKLSVELSLSQTGG